MTVCMRERKREKEWGNEKERERERDLINNLEQSSEVWEEVGGRRGQKMKRKGKEK